MIDMITRDRLKEMRLTGMVECLDQLASPDTTALTTVDVVKLITDREWERRRNSKLARLRRAADLAQPHADVTDLRVLPDRTIDTDLVGRLAVGNYIAKHEDVIVLGPTGSGKSYLACALGNKAAQQYKSVLYLRAVDLFDRLTLAERAGSRSQTLAKLVKVDLLILDEWFTSPPTVEQVRHLHAQNSSGDHTYELPARGDCGIRETWATRLYPSDSLDRLNALSDISAWPPKEQSVIGFLNCPSPVSSLISGRND